MTTGGYREVRGAITPFEEKAPETAAEASARLDSLQPQLLKKYERWQWIDALFILCYTSAMGIVCLVAKRSFGWGRWAICAIAAVLLVIVVGEAMENVAIIGFISGRHRLGLLHAGTRIKWVSFPIGVAVCIVLLVWLGIARLRSGPRSVRTVG